jgi:hypothetical protein
MSLEFFMVVLGGVFLSQLFVFRYHIGVISASVFGTIGGSLFYAVLVWHGYMDWYELHPMPHDAKGAAFMANFMAMPGIWAGTKTAGHLSWRYPLLRDL